MKHKFNFFWDVWYPLLWKLVGHRHSCCSKVKNCTKCIKKNGWKESI